MPDIRSLTIHVPQNSSPTSVVLLNKIGAIQRDLHVVLEVDSGTVFLSPWDQPEYQTGSFRPVNYESRVPEGITRLDIKLNDHSVSETTSTATWEYIKRVTEGNRMDLSMWSTHDGRSYKRFANTLGTESSVQYGLKSTSDGTAPRVFWTFRDYLMAQIHQEEDTSEPPKRRRPNEEREQRRPKPPLTYMTPADEIRTQLRNYKSSGVPKQIEMLCEATREEFGRDKWKHTMAQVFRSKADVEELLGVDAKEQLIKIILSKHPDKQTGRKGDLGSDEKCEFTAAMILRSIK